MKRIMTAVITSATLAACGTSDNAKPFDPKPVEVKDGRLTSEVIWQLARVGQAQVNANDGSVAFDVTYTDIEENRNFTDVYLTRRGQQEPTRLTRTVANEMEVRWLPDGRIAYLAPAPKDVQLWVMDADGGNQTQLTDIEGGVTGYVIAPDMKHVAYTRNVKVDQTITDKYPDMPKATARIETDLMYRHWNEWSDGTYSHVCIATFDGKTVGEEIDIMSGERYHSPLPPFGGMEQICFSPCGTKLIYTCKKLTGMAAARSTDSGLYEYDLQTGNTRLLTEGMNGYDTNPQYSADGSRLFWLSMEHAGYESDKNRLMMRNLATGETVELTDQTEDHVNAFAPSRDGKTVWFVANHKACDRVFGVDIATHAIRCLTPDDVCDYTTIAEASDGHLVANRMSMKAPSEIYELDPQTGHAEPLTQMNLATLSQLKPFDIEERWMTTTDQKQMHTWIVYPPDFDPTKKYPTLLYCQGGPQQTVSQFWSLRWNFALMAANGYVVVAPNRRGLPGFGREWNEQISGDYGGQNMLDYLTAIDNVSREPWCDSERLGAVGASYGGFSVYWLAGHHEKRFKTFIAHCGVFDLERLYATTEELFFPDWDLKGAPWDTQNAAAQKSYAASPHKFVNEWDTPILVIHGEKDFRIPYTQGMAAFNIAVMKGIPAEFLYFPDECHWVQKPQNSIVWHREFFSWLDKWLKD